MKKNKIFSPLWAIFSLLAVIFLTTSIFSCKSAPKAAVKVGALDVLDGEAGFFLYIPGKSQQEFITKSIMSFSEGISEKNASLIASRTDEVAVAIGGKKRTDFQLASSGNYPQGAIKKSFTEENGWKNEIYAVDGISYNIYTEKSSKSPLSTSFPENMALIGNEVEDALNRYNFLAFDTVAAPSETKKIAPASWNQAIYDYLLSGKNGEIMYFAKNPELALKFLIGKEINLGMRSISGSLAASKNDKFALEILIELSDPRTMTAALSIVKLAIFPVAAKITQKDATHIKIQDLMLEYKDLFPIFTGKK